MNYAKSSENSLAAINSGSGDQNIDNSTHLHLSGLVHLSETAKGSIIFDPNAMWHSPKTVDT